MSLPSTPESRLIAGRIDKLDDKTRDKFLLLVLNLDHVRTESPWAFGCLTAFLGAVASINKERDAVGTIIAKCEIALEDERTRIGVKKARELLSSEKARQFEARQKTRKGKAKGNLVRVDFRGSPQGAA